MRVTSLPISKSPKTASLLIIRNLRLMGFPFLRGFYSKDALLEYALSRSLGLIAGVLFVMGTALTVIYTSRYILLSSGRPLIRPAVMQHGDKD